MLRQIRITGTGMTALGRLNRSVEDLCKEAVHKALADAKLNLKDLDGIVALPALAESHFMPAQFIATKLGIFPRNGFVCRSIDSGGAGPISALFTGSALIKNEWANNIAIIGGDAVLSMGSKQFLEKADGSIEGCHGLPSPRIPNGYDFYAQWHMKKYGVTREQLAMIPVIESHLAVKHPMAMCKKPLTLEEVLNSPKIGKVTNLLECARRADGAACIILSNASWYKRHLGANGKPQDKCPVIISTGEASGPLFPPPSMDDVTEEYFSCERAAKVAYKSAQLSSSDIDFFGLYDCFPICLLKALVACRVVRRGDEGAYIEEVYNRLLKTGKVDTRLFPINTHSGLLCFGAPWEVPAMFNTIEAVAQLNGDAGERQIWCDADECRGAKKQKPRRALVYGNGGIFSSSAVAILGSGDILSEESAGYHYPPNDVPSFEQTKF
jgi:acetyl-CoA acetyltransferase